jgi:hypothetical protein
MKALSCRQADRCENAKGPRCRCRCGGACHGIGRISDAEGFRDLPEDDPHHIRRRRPLVEQLVLPEVAGW